MNPQEVAETIDSLVDHEILIDGILNLGETPDDLSYITERRGTNPAFANAVLVNFGASINTDFFRLIQHETDDAEMPTIHFAISLVGTVTRASDGPFRVVLAKISSIVLYFKGRMIFIRVEPWELAQFPFADPRNLSDLDWWLKDTPIDQIPCITTEAILNASQPYLNKNIRLCGEIIGTIPGERNHYAYELMGMWIAKPKSKPNAFQLPLWMSDFRWYDLADVGFEDDSEDRFAPGAHNCICLYNPLMTDAISRMRPWGRIGGLFHIMENACVLGGLVSSRIAPYELEIEPAAIAIQRSLHANVIHLWTSGFMMQP